MATAIELIAKTTLGSSAANIEFTSIPDTYTDLVLVCTTRSDRGGSANGAVLLTFNGTTSGYSGRKLIGTGGFGVTASNSDYMGTTSTDITGFTGTSAGDTANTFTSTECYIPNYAGSTNKSFSITSVHETNASTAYIILGAALWSNTAAITSIKLAENSTYNFVSGSSFFLYGITKA